MSRTTAIHVAACFCGLNVTLGCSNSSDVSPHSASDAGADIVPDSRDNPRDSTVEDQAVIDSTPDQASDTASDGPDDGQPDSAPDAEVDASPPMAVPKGLIPTLVSGSTLSVQDTATDGQHIAWVGKTDADSTTQVFALNADLPYSPTIVSPKTGWIDAGSALWKVATGRALVTWRAWDETTSTYRVYAKDFLSTNPIVDVSDAALNPGAFHTNQRVVVWESGLSPNFFVNAYQLDTGKRLSIPVNAVDTTPYPRTDGRFLTWMGGNWPVFDIFVCDLNAAEPAPIRITTGGWNAQPVVDNGIVAWYRDQAGSTDIYYADVTKSPIVPVRVTNTVQPDEYPDVSDGVIVWAASDGTDHEVYYFDTKATAPSVVKVTDNDQPDGQFPSIPRINKGRIVWAGNVTGVAEPEIFTYDLHAVSPSVQRVTNDNRQDMRPRVANGLITWIADGAAYAARP